MFQKRREPRIFGFSPNAGRGDGGGCVGASRRVDGVMASGRSGVGGRVFRSLPPDDSCYSVKFLSSPKGCLSCSTSVREGFAGFQYSDPLCVECFGVLAPGLSSLMSCAVPVAIQTLESLAYCANCGDVVRGSFAGYHFGDVLCWSCFSEQSPSLALLLVMASAGALAGKMDEKTALRLFREYLRVLKELQE